MQTRKPISTVSFNSKDFLIGKLEELTSSGKLEFWSVIEHQPEPDEVTDEAGHKSHFHVYMEPAKQLQTTSLRSEFQEPDPIVGKPKGCLQIVSSKFDDWYLYALHDVAYLASKKQRRVWSYEAEEIISSNADDLQQKVSQIDYGARNTYLTMYEYQRQGKTYTEYMVGEMLNPRDVIAYERAWNLMAQFDVERNGKPNHPNSLPSEEPALESKEPQLKAELPMIDASVAEKMSPYQMTIEDLLKMQPKV